MLRGGVDGDTVGFVRVVERERRGEDCWGRSSAKVKEMGDVFILLGLDCILVGCRVWERTADLWNMHTSSLMKLGY